MFFGLSPLGAVHCDKMHHTTRSTVDTAKLQTAEGVRGGGGDGGGGGGGGEKNAATASLNSGRVPITRPGDMGQAVYGLSIKTVLITGARR